MPRSPGVTWSSPKPRIRPRASSVSASCWPAEGLIEAVYVDPEAGRRGIGAALVAALEREARTRGARTLALEASLNSVPFYLAQGFDVETAAQHALAPGVALRCMVMSKALVPTGSPCPTR